MEAFSTPRNKLITLVLLAACGLLTIASVVVGINDNPPGVILALLSAITLILAFAHPWRDAKRFFFLFLASVIGFVLFIIMSIVSESLLQNPAASRMLKNLIQSPMNDTLSLISSMIFTAALIIGVIGSVVMLIRKRRKSR